MEKETQNKLFNTLTSKEKKQLKTMFDNALVGDRYMYYMFFGVNNILSL